MAINKKDIRKAFRNACFARDHYACRKCGIQSTYLKAEQELDAHHTTPREKMPNGGYVKSNGISLCKNSCHLKAERFLSHGENSDFSPENLYKLISSSLKIAYKASENISKTHNNQSGQKLN